MSVMLKDKKTLTRIVFELQTFAFKDQCHNQSTKILHTPALFLFDFSSTIDLQSLSIADTMISDFLILIRNSFQIIHDLEQYICGLGHCSMPTSLSPHVPHGSVLGLILFTMYINDL